MLTVWIRLRKSLVRNRIPLFVIALYLPTSYLLAGTTCLLKSTTGLPCPGCGLTRAVLYAVHGDFAAAFQAHPLFPLGLLLLLLLPVILYRLPKALERKAFQFFGLGVILLFIAVYVVRMVQGFPGDPPMDYNTESVIGRLYNLLF